MSGWKLQLALGVLSVIAGIFILMNPFAASLAVEQLAGWSFLILGIVQIVEAFMAEGWGGKLWSLALGLLGVLLGLNLIGKPLAGLVALTIVVGMLFLVSGAIKLSVGFRIRSSNLKWAIILSGVASLALAFIVLTNIPFSAVATLGILLGIEMLSNGATGIALAVSRKSGGSAA